MAEVNAEPSQSSPYGELLTEYSDNFRWTTTNAYKYPYQSYETLNPNVRDELRPPTNHPRWETPIAAYNSKNFLKDPDRLHSTIYPSIYRETKVKKDERGHYIDPFKTIATKPYGRRLIYDQTHPDKMYSSQWSSELADMPGCYSFPTTTGLAPEIPWRRDLQWKADGEMGEWATPQWKQWTQVAMCPPYDGHDDQVEYSKYKVQGPWTTMYPA